MPPSQALIGRTCLAPTHIMIATARNTQISEKTATDQNSEFDGSV